MTDPYDGRFLASDPARPDGWVIYDRAGHVVAASAEYRTLLTEVTGRRYYAAADQQ